MGEANSWELVRGWGNTKGMRVVLYFGRGEACLSREGYDWWKQILEQVGLHIKTQRVNVNKKHLIGLKVILFSRRSDTVISNL